MRPEGQVDELITAIKQRDRQAVTLPLDRDPALASERSSTGGTPAITARYRRAGEILELFDADPSLIRSHAVDGWPPFHLAAHFRHQRMVELLLERGADVHLRARNSYANTPLHAALAGGAGVVLVQRLLDAGVTVDARQGGGYTGLHEYGHVAIARMLTERARIG